MVAGSKSAASGNLCTCEGKPLCPLARKVPKVLRGGGAQAGSAVQVDSLNRKMFVHIIDKLFKRQNYIQSIHSVLFSDDYPMGADPNDELLNAAWPADGVKTLKRIPKGWIAAWLHRSYKAVGLTKELLRAVENDDTSSIHLLFGVALQMPLSTGLPVSMQDDEELTERVLDARAQEVGHRIRILLATGAINEDGSLDYSKGVAYECQWTGEEADSLLNLVVHKATNTRAAVPAAATIRRDTPLRDPWFDALARFQVPKIPDLPVHVFYDECDFTKLICDEKNSKKRLDDLSKGVRASGGSAAATEATASASSSFSALPIMDGKAGAEAIQEAIKDSAKTRTAKARKAMADKASQRNSKRVIKMMP